MYDPIEFNNFTKERHQRMITDAAHDRRFPHSQSTRMQTFGKLLINVGQKLQSQQATTARPALNLK